MDTDSVPTMPASPGETERGKFHRVRWNGFLRALAEEIDNSAGAAARDGLLRNVGLRMARLMPLPITESLDGLTIEANDILGAIGWGSASVTVSEADRCLMIVHRGLPRLGAAGNPPGAWLSALLEGLYEGWLGQQPGSTPGLTARRQPIQSANEIVLRYGRN
jgi:Cellulose synthase subunit D